MRVLIDGCPLLMRSGGVKNYVYYWLEHLRKLAGPELALLPEENLAFHEAEYQRLRVELQAAHEASPLPEAPAESTRAALNDLLLRVRLRGRPYCGGQ